MERRVLDWNSNFLFKGTVNESVGNVLKGTVVVISSDLPLKEYDARYTTVPFKLNLVKMWKILSLF